MARIRSIHPDACQSEKLAGVSAEAERLYWRLATHCDDEGRCEDDPRIIRSFLFPLLDDLTVAEVDEWLTELADARLLARYDIGGRKLIQVGRWRDYQRPQKPRKSTLPPPSDTDSGTGTRQVPDESRTPTVAVYPQAEGGITTTARSGEGVGEGVERTPPTPPALITDTIDAAVIEVGNRHNLPQLATERGSNPDAYLASCHKAIRAQLVRHDRYGELVNRRATAAQFADLLEPRGRPAIPPPNPHEGCEACGGTGWIEDDNRTATRCRPLHAVPGRAVSA